MILIFNPILLLDVAPGRALFYEVRKHADPYILQSRGFLDNTLDGEMHGPFPFAKTVVFFEIVQHFMKHFEQRNTNEDKVLTNSVAK